MKAIILSASVGAGHIRAAEAVEAAMRRESPHAEVQSIDVLARMTPAFRKLYRDGYLEMVRRAPQLLGWLYHATDKPFHQDPVRSKLEQAGALKLMKEVRSYAPDVAICTHFLPTALLDHERSKGRFSGRIVTVVTDYEVHGAWLGAPSDHYFVATEEARAHFIALGIEPERITVSGIPTHPVFSEPKNRAEMKRKHGLRADMPVILVSAGGFGAGNAGRMVEALIEAKIRAQVVAVCGKSAPLKAAIEKIAAKHIGAAALVQAIGFTTEMDELMAASDLMIGKPGGLTTAESFVKGLAWVVVNPIPGQEEKNAIYLLENGAGVWCDNLYTLGYKVRHVLEDPGRLQSMRAQSLGLARPDAASVVQRESLAPTSNSSPAAKISASV
ncbi:MAG: glycosyltransferase [Bryobacteraceae bacterium]